MARQPISETQGNFADYQSYLPIVLLNYNILDSDFDHDGRVTTDFSGGEDFAYAVAVQPDGKIIVAGYADSVDFGIARYNPDGSLDTTFGGDGRVTTDISGDIDHGSGVALQPDGKILLAGRAYLGGDCDFALVRYNTDGSLDMSFSGDGKVTTDFSGNLDFGYAIVVQPDGKIAFAGSTMDDSYDFALARYNPNGSLDTSFSGDGKVNTNFSIYSADNAYGIILQPDGKLVVAGGTGLGNSNFALARYNPDGSLDTTFNSDGLVTTDFFGHNDYAYGVVQQSDGKIVAAGYAATSMGSDYALVRYNQNGSLDTTFGSNGLVTTDFYGLNGDFGKAVLLMPDNKIVVAGNSGNNFALARYKPDGNLDTAFDTDGKVITDFGGFDIGTSVTLQLDGKIIVAGYVSIDATYDFGVARYRCACQVSP